MSVNGGPGWYPDPDGSMQMRYWDGRSWTGDYGGPVKKGVGRVTFIAGAAAAVVIIVFLWSYVLPGCGIMIEPRPVTTSETR